jgi:hypothetical protein
MNNLVLDESLFDTFEDTAEVIDKLRYQTPLPLDDY